TASGDGWVRRQLGRMARARDASMPIALSVVASALATHAAYAQCPNWDTTGSSSDIGVPGLTGPGAYVNVLASLDFDGPGGSAPRLYAGGVFGFAGTAAAANVAVWNDTNSTW